MTVIPFPARRRMLDEISTRLRPEAIALLRRAVDYFNAAPSVDAPWLERLFATEVCTLLIELSAWTQFASEWCEGSINTGEARRSLRRLSLLPVEPREVGNEQLLRFAAEANALSLRMRAAASRLQIAMSLPEAG